MDIMFLVLMLGINGLISWWNCKVTGEAWVEVMQTSGTFMKVLLWSGAVQATVGFSMIYLFGLIGFGTVFGLFGDYQAYITELATSAWYLVIILPALMTGYIIMVHSWIIAWRERNLMNLGGAAWNTFASAYNTYHAIDGIGKSFGVVSEGISTALEGGDGQSKAARLALLLAVVALLAGGFTTYAIIKRYQASKPLPERTATA